MIHTMFPAGDPSSFRVLDLEARGGCATIFTVNYYISGSE
jgi:hypothetical protein